MFLFFFFRDFLILALAIGIVLGFYQSLLTIKKYIYTCTLTLAS